MNQEKKLAPITLTKRTRQIMCGVAILIILFAFTITAIASSPTDVETVMNNMSKFIFSAIKAIGLILMGLGVVQIGLAFKGHDPAQRATGMLCLFGGILIAFSKEIIEAIAGVTIG